jgi:hypothetical protein
MEIVQEILAEEAKKLIIPAVYRRISSRNLDIHEGKYDLDLNQLDIDEFADDEAPQLQHIIKDRHQFNRDKFSKSIIKQLFQVGEPDVHQLNLTIKKL